uniref:zinc finger protein 593-like n=1 Tax=Styela clava TaxID=7725 RepID=UPI00193969AF|nr:zinc finger protein 593-like [Styela clava]
MGNAGKSKGSGKKSSDSHKNYGKRLKTKRRTKDVDQIHEDMKPGNKNKLLNQPIDTDLPGEGQNYCLHCARHFIDITALKSHFKTKVHKRRLKQLATEPYTQEEAERAAGMGNYITPKRLKVETQSVPEEMDDKT